MIKKFIEQFNKTGEIYLRIKVRPAAAESGVKRILQDSDGEIIKIDLAAPAVKNKANLELIGFLARAFAISKNNVKIISGAGERFKLVKLVK
ncbi:MAG: DUF167 domain-containing protein [bacterium]|nr:DUF167 domain-containing protein [bacterium]